MKTVTFDESVWQLVPKEPTEEMHNAARDWSVKKYGVGVGIDGSDGCYRSMLAAAPTAKQDVAETAEEVKPEPFAYFWEYKDNPDFRGLDFSPLGEEQKTTFNNVPLYTRPPADAALLEEAIRALEPVTHLENQIGRSALAAVEKIKARIGGE